MRLNPESKPVHELCLCTGFFFIMIRPMYLYINTTQRDSFTIALASKEGILKKKTVKSARKSSEKLLKTIHQLLASNKQLLSNIKRVFVAQGPGSFTSLRIGILTANALAYALEIPVIGVRNDAEFKNLKKFINTNQLFKKPVVPSYGAEPSIT
jgi:tRNA A37 threonylcarbamoyladenosine modification protein TsaB